MSTQYPPPEPAAFALIQKAPALASPGQQAILGEFAAGQIGIETTVYQLMQEVKERFPALKAAREAAADERATRARELREMAENEKAAGPTFVEYTPEGRPVNEPALLPAGSLVAVVPSAAAPVVPAAPEPDAEALSAKTDPLDEESTDEDSLLEESDESKWIGVADEQQPDFD